MWKESYKIGIKTIDDQHQALFLMVADLLRAIEGGADAQAFAEGIKFLKEYVVVHFRDEEAYQEAIGYDELAAHRKAHQDFTEQVLLFDKRLMDSDYALPVVKELAGTLTAWLIYHVADSDQKIALFVAKQSSANCINHFSASVLDVLEKMAGLDMQRMTEQSRTGETLTGDVFIEIDLHGGIKGSAVFGFSQELAFQLIEIMTMMQPQAIDELVCSALGEIANIASGNAATTLSSQGLACDIKPPIVSNQQPRFNQAPDAIFIDTGIGGLEVAVYLEK